MLISLLDSAAFFNHKNNSTTMASQSSHQSSYALAISYIVQELVRSNDEGATLNLTKLKGDASKKYKLRGISQNERHTSGPPDSVPRQTVALPADQTRTDGLRSRSGGRHEQTAPVSAHCLHGQRLVYCPGGPDSDFEYSTQAYTVYEPTSMRAIRARYDPYSQVRGRVQQLRAIGHTVDKVEFIVMGGTFLSLDKEYKYVLLCAVD